MNNPIFFDTSGMIALLHGPDPQNARAKELAEQFEAEARHTLTTTVVLAELGDGFARKGRWKVAEQFIDTFLTHPLATVNPVGIELLRKACELRNNRPDKDWGLTDCISFVVMADESIQEAFTADRHFQQAGFRALLLESSTTSN